MNKFKQMMKIFIVALLVTMTNASCQDNYKDLDDGLYAEFQTTKGTMVAKLNYEEVPVVVANFVALAEGTHPKVADEFKGKPYYDGITFHRVMDKFMIQGGDHTASGSGNPGYRFHSEFDKNLKHDRPGILSMANSGGLNTNGSQFFITEVPYQSLDAFDKDGNLKPCDRPRVSCHSVFGELVKGLEVQDSISNVSVSKERTSMNKPLEDVVITKLNIIRKGASAKAFDAVKIFTEEEPKLAQKIVAIKQKQEEAIKEKAKIAAANFKEANKNVKGEVIEMPSGIVMIKTKEGNGVTPKPTDKVSVNCAGYFENGKLFYTTWKDVAEANGIYNEAADKQGAYNPFDQPYNAKATLIPGFREAFLKMKTGDKVKVFIPSHLGYGSAPNGPIPGNSNLIFDIELVEIKK
ncbi:peptidylprolyl isomerase [uncultured Lacinutrix sp.]|uniref:peptidylprolyl isomerase n=1 Tax=uncultured Lacinutrix sp. TaxID=574032 RepID=UPI00261CF750|nr:peptidylprolyl isomerase [uncultured Lacinutrix sp.]